jgi:hypothetical protein
VFNLSMTLKKYFELATPVRREPPALCVHNGR